MLIEIPWSFGTLSDHLCTGRHCGDDQKDSLEYLESHDPQKRLADHYSHQGMAFGLGLQVGHQISMEHWGLGRRLT